MSDGVATDARKGHWMQTFTGRAFWPLDPRAGEVDIVDIAHALSNICRYGGHCRAHYSVAQHSVLVARAVPRSDRLWGLLHDAAEAYVGDIPRPLKCNLPCHADIEARVMEAIARHFGLPVQMPESVERADTAILVDEFRDLMDAPPMPLLGLPAQGIGIEIKPWAPRDARAMFLREFRELTRP